MRNQGPLFCREFLDSRLSAGHQKVLGIVGGIPKDQFLASSDQELEEYVVAKLRVEPIVLQEDNATMTSNETRVDVPGAPMITYFHNPIGSPRIPGIQVDINIPFTGDKWLFFYRENTWSSVFPRAGVQPGCLRLTITKRHNADPDSFKTDYDREISLIRKYVDLSHKQVVGYNKILLYRVKKAIKERRDRLRGHDDIAARLNIPLATKPSAPSITPVKVEVRYPPALPKPPKSGLVPEPGITDEDFERILHFIRHQGRTFERTPSTYAVHGEEDLRNIILAQLNGQFKGNAMSEVFRGKGKTDLCIEQDSRSAFVGECKLWNGPAGLTAALGQLLGYLTWRDSKSALIMFNVKNKNFTEILKTMPETLRAHPLFLRDLNCSEAGEWRVQMRSAEDEGRRVTVHAFVFNLSDN